MKAGILLGQLDNYRNESALIRTAEALGINQVFAVDVDDESISNTVSRGTHKHVSVHHYDTYEDFIGHISDKNYSIVCVENTPDSVEIEHGVDYPVNPIFVTGNEGQGIPEEVMKYNDKVVQIKQSPNSYVRCLNTTVAGSIVMHDWFSNRVNRDKSQKYDVE